MSSDKLVKVTLIKSLVGTRRTLRKNVIGLGLSKINSSVEITDNSANRGMINKVSFLLKIEG
ncbi:MAG: 50S ribosomal protein L30 [Nitrosomonas sp.]|jgi:large subunit ribosomal protein L30|nr:50S ribosomal protein L30 [Nitrosomonas sp.]